VNPNGSLRDVRIHDVVPGDHLLVRPSEIVPVDATLDSPHAEFDESSLTGESLPVERVAGDVVLSGSVNGERAVHLIAAKYAKDSEYQAIVALVQQAATSKAPLVRLADRYAVPFTALAYLIAGLAWWLSGDAVRFAEVLVVATPCPLLIAAPVAFMGGMSQAATKGIVIKDAGTLERLSRVRTVAFDKTGTLTRGTPEVVRVEVKETELPADYLLALVASIEQYSTHVLAQAIVGHAKEQSLSLFETDQVTEFATDGVRGTVDSREVVVGKARFVSENTSPVGPIDLGSGETAVFVGVDRQYVGYLVLRDTLRPEAIHTINRFRGKRLAPYIKEVFVRVVELLVNEGVLDLKTVYTDGTFMEARSNRYTFVWAKNTARYKANLITQLEQVWAYASVGYRAGTGGH
jgi:P-type E1-E2 ATPase